MDALHAPVAILGGTFDPVHYGHLHLAEDIRRALALPQVRLIPAGDPPHRGGPAASAADRVAMLDLAVRDMPGLAVDRREVERAGKSYTVLTLEELRAEDASRPTLLCLGADAFHGLPTWHRWQDILRLAHIVVAVRPGVELDRDMPAELEAVWRSRHVTDPAVLQSHPAAPSTARPSIPGRFRPRRYGCNWRAANSAARLSSNCCRPPFWPILTFINSIAPRAPHPRMRLNKLTQTAVTALEDIKAQDIKVLDVRKHSTYCDYLIIATAESNRQVKALAHHVRDRMKESGGKVIGLEGEETGDWVLVDCGDIVVHVMQPAVRAYYNLEELWDRGTSRPRAKAA